MYVIGDIGNTETKICVYSSQKKSIKKIILKSNLISHSYLKKKLFFIFKKKADIKKTITIKPPNDLLVDKKKICGILQEIKFNQKHKFIIIGIGINLIKNPIIKNYPTTNIFKEIGYKVKRPNLIKNIEKNYIKNLKLFA